MKTGRIKVIAKWMGALVLVAVWAIALSIWEPPPAATFDDHFMNAAARGNLAAIEALLDRGANIEATNKRGSIALMLAAVRGRLEAVRLLIKKGRERKRQEEERRYATSECCSEREP